MAKHVTEARCTECDQICCHNCGDILELSFHPDHESPLWMQLAIKDAFVAMHKDCDNDPQPVPTFESLRYERAQ